MSYASISNLPKHFQHLPEGIRRAIEVSMVPGFSFTLIDLTPNNYFAGMGVKLIRDFRDPLQNHLHYVIEKGVGTDYLKTGDKESSEVVMERVNDARKLFMDGRPIYKDDKYFVDIYNQICDHSEPAKQMFNKAVKVFDGTFTEIRNCLFLAEAIRALDKSEMVKSHHVAEAIQYSFPRDEEDGDIF